MRPKVPPKAKNKRRIISASHLNMVRQLPCVLSGRPAEVAHISYGDLNHENKPHNAMGIKADDVFCVPLCPSLHRLHPGSQHNHNEKLWWQQFGVDPVAIALRLWKCGRNYDAMVSIVESVELTPAAQTRVLEILEGKK